MKDPRGIIIHKYFYASLDGYVIILWRFAGDAIARLRKWMSGWVDIHLSMLSCLTFGSRNVISPLTVTTASVIFSTV